MACSKALAPWVSSRAMRPRVNTASWGTAFGGAFKEDFRTGGGMVEAVGGAVLAGGAFVLDEGLDVCGVFDLLAAVEGARMLGNHLARINDAHGVQAREDDQGAAHIGVGDGVVVQVKAHVGCLTDADLDTL